KGRTLTIGNAAETLMDIQQAGGGQGIFHAMDEKDVIRIMKDPNVAIATDGSAVDFGKSVPHPRNYGTFVRVLRKYVREDKILSLETAIHKMTGLPARRLKFKDRGLLKINMVADIVIFDPAQVNDPADWANPHQYATGLPHVIVNGESVILNHKRTENFPGKILKNNARG
ncbi:MAG: amidohydrolase family protein, partial [Psychrosphaera sp.]|nr:amidohydrolase family protein [Psychrosphaera sp.]